MPAASSSSPLHSFALLLCRLALGGLFVEAGLTKLLKMGMTAWYQQKYLPSVPPWMRGWDWFNQPYGHAVPFLEIAVGALVVLGLFGRVGTGVMALMLVSFTIAVLQAAPRPDAPPLPIVHSNWIFLALALLLTVTGPGALSLDALLWRGGRRTGA